MRRGAAFFVLRKDGAVLVRTRPPRGLLGGMTELPTSEWTHEFDDASALDHAPKFSGRKANGHGAWRQLPGKVTHVFTHFPLELTVYATELPAGTRPPAGARFVPLAELHQEALPNVMRKVVALALQMSEVGGRRSAIRHPISDI
jgi:A/G-specific adenine glycosylase